MQNKTLLAKIVGLVAVMCLALAMVFGLVACGNNENQLTKDDKVVASVVLSGDKFQVTYVDGTKSEYAVGSVKDIKVLENGQTEITYADGTKVNVGDVACNHNNYSDRTVIKPASCCEVGVAVKKCATCGSVALEAVEKDSTIHGKWSIEPKVNEGEVILNVNEEEHTITYERYDSGTFAYALTTQYEYGTLTILEGYSGVAENCFEAKCALCGEQFAKGHAPVDQWIDMPVDDPNVNACENEFKAYKACPVCKSVFLYDEDGNIVVTKQQAKGHNYNDPEVIEKVGQGSTAYYRLRLYCPSCREGITVRADYKSQQVADCKDRVTVIEQGVKVSYSGWTTYEYKYYNWIDGVKTEITETIDLDFEARSDKHIVDNSLAPFQYYDPIESPYEYEFTEEIKPFFTNDTIKWNAGQPATCSDYKLATFACKVCGEAIVIRISGEHQYAENDQGTVVNPTCIYDGYTYKVCTENEEHIWRYAIKPATAHNYKYVADTFVVTDEETGNGTATFKCACGSEIELPVTFISETVAPTCETVSYKSYRATASYYITHIDAYGKNMQPVQKNDPINFKIDNEGEIPKHTLADVEGLTRFTAYDPETNPQKYDYTDLIGALIATEEDSTQPLKWNAGIPGTCSEYKLATFTCTVCNNAIVIYLSGEHEALDYENENGQNVAVDATCTERGYTKVYCADCQRLVETSATDAKGHKFAPKAADWNAFLANPTDGAAIEFVCSACPATVEPETITLYAKKTAGTPVQNGCETVTTDVYDFYDEDDKVYTYYVQSAEGEFDIKKEFTHQWKDVKTVGSHTIGTYNGVVIRETAYNVDAPIKVDSLPAHVDFIAKDILRWNAGIPGTCSEYKFAVFTCEECGKAIVIYLSGEHTFAVGEDYTRTTLPTCTEEGYTEQYCTSCRRWIKTEIVPALGHEYGVWQIVGNLFQKAYENNGYVYFGEGEDDYNFGSARCVCQREGCNAELKAEAYYIGGQLPTCGAEGVVLVGYIDDNGDTVATTEILVAKIDHHITTLETAKHVIKWYDDGMYYLGYYCEFCGEVRVATKSADEAVINRIISNLTADYVEELLYGRV